MPTSALDHVDVDHVLPAADIGGLLVRLAGEPMIPLPPNHQPDVVARGGPGLTQPPDGMLQPYTCPECGGALWRSASEDLDRVECHVGHSFAARTLAALQDGRLAGAMWTALRHLEESAALRRRLATRVARGGLATLAEAYEQQATHTEQRATALRELLVESPPPPAPVTDDDLTVDTA